MTRGCLAHECGVAVRRGQWMCVEHWLTLPIEKRDRLLSAWRDWNAARPNEDVQAKADLTWEYHDALQSAIDHFGSRYTDIFGNSVSAKVTVETAGAAVGCHASATGRAAGAGTLYAAAARPFIIVPYLGDAA